MKLYTEEQVRKAFMDGSDFVWDDKEEYTQGVNEYVKLSLTPIELPSDEEIEKEINSNICIDDDVSFRDGAKWVINEILFKIKYP